MKKLIASLGFAALFTVGFACDLQKTSDQLQANKVMVATVLSTPPVTIDPLALAGFDAGGFDAGGFTFDAGELDGGAFFADGGLVIPGQTIGLIFFGQRQDQSLNTPPNGLQGGTATIQVKGAATATTLKDEGGGNYDKNSVDDPSFQYQNGADYEFSVAYQGDTYTGLVSKAPPLEQIPEFHPPKGFIELAAGNSFTFTRPDPPANESRNFGFVEVFPIENNGQKGQPTYDNIPKTPLEFLKLVAAPAEWRGSPVTIPGTAFPVPDKNYVIVFQAVKNGGPESSNLFTGSAILAGTAEIGVVKTH